MTDESNKQYLDLSQLRTIRDGLEVKISGLESDKTRVEGELARARSQGNSSVIAILEGSLSGINTRLRQAKSDLALINIMINSSAPQNERERQPTTSLYGQPVKEGQSDSLLLTPNDSTSVNTVAPPAPSVPDLKAEEARHQAMLGTLYPNVDQPQLPPLVLRDGQSLSRSEQVFPAMDYDEDIYEPWPDDAVAAGIEKYPDLVKNPSVARRLNIDDPFAQPEDDGEYLLPRNPTFADLARHEQSKRKKPW
jgi:hypothetical protein